MGLSRLARETAEIHAEASVMDGVRLMAERRVGAVAVLEGRRLVGIFTERDLAWRVVQARRDPDRTQIREVMTTAVRTVTDEATVEQAASLMRAHHVRHLPIVDEHGDFRGMIALRYLLYDLLDHLELKVDDLEGFIMADGPGG